MADQMKPLTFTEWLARRVPPLSNAECLRRWRKAKREKLRLADAALRR